MTLGQRITYYRKQLGISLAELIDTPDAPADDHAAASEKLSPFSAKIGIGRKKGTALPFLFYIILRPPLLQPLQSRLLPQS